MGCDRAGSAPPSGTVILKGPDGESRQYKEWPLDAKTLHGATLTCSDFPQLKWEFAANGTHTLTNGGEKLPIQMSDLIQTDPFLQSKKATGKWSLTDLGAGGIREMSIKFTARENQREIGIGFYAMPYHSSAQFVHFVKDYGGIGGFGRV